MWNIDALTRPPMPVDAAAGRTTKQRLGVTTTANFQRLAETLLVEYKHSVVIGGKPCGGHLVLDLEDDTCKGHGGEFFIKIVCSNCEREFTFGGVDASPGHLDAREGHLQASLNHSHMRSVGFSILTSYLLSGTGQYGMYAKFLGRLSADFYKRPRFAKYMAVVATAVQDQIKEEIAMVKDYIQSARGATWSWENPVFAADGSWNTPGHNAPHHVFMVRAPLLYGAILAIVYKSRSDPYYPFLSTAKSAEALSAMDAFTELKDQLFASEGGKLIRDGDASLAIMARAVFEVNLLMRACCGHVNKNAGLRLEAAAAIKTKRGFSSCTCAGGSHRHKSTAREPRCGCISKSLPAMFKRWNESLMQKAGELCDADWYAQHVSMIKLCVRDVHKYTDPDSGEVTVCAHHNNTWRFNDEYRVDCPLHYELLEECIDHLADNASEMIDASIGRVNDNWLESGFSHVWMQGFLKRCILSHDHLMVSTGVGVLNSHRTAMAAVAGEKYTWVLRVFERLGLEVTPALAQAELKTMSEHHEAVLRSRNADQRRRKNIHKAGRVSRGKQRQQVSAHLRSHLPSSFDLEYTSNSTKDVGADGAAPVLGDIVKTGMTLVLLDANELLMYREYDADACKYTLEVTRPFVRDFVLRLAELPGAKVGLWTGVHSAAQEAKILALLRHAGVPKSTFAIVLRAFPCCGRKGRNMYFPGTTKRIFVKPVALVEPMLPEFSHYLLVDNDLEKSLGLGRAGARRLANGKLQHLEPPPFRGELIDAGLEPDRGAVWNMITERLQHLQ
jgi:hypothetical protein